MMTRKDYIAVSDILRDYADDIDQDVFFDLVYDFANYMAEDNERFLSDKFVEACGIPKEEYPSPRLSAIHVALA